MKTIPPVKTAFFRVFFLSVLTVCLSSCRKVNPIEKSLKAQTFAQTEKEETEVFFFISSVNVSTSIISKSQIAQQKSSDVIVQELSKRIEIQQNQFLDEITRLATSKLIVITEIDGTHKRDLYNLIDAKENDFNNVYLYAMQEKLCSQIDLLETISRETNDKKILELVLRFLPEQFKLLRETERIIKQSE